MDGPVRALNWWGVAFVAVGVWWLLDVLGPDVVGFDARFSWSYAGPIALVAIGLNMLLRSRRR